MKVVIDKEEIDINTLSAYIPSLLSELRSETSWTLNQTKVFVYILSQYYKDKILIPKNTYTHDTVNEVAVSNLSRSLAISKKLLMELTGISLSQFSRDIKKVTHGLKASVATIPSSLEPKIKTSYIHRSWFEEFEYLDDQGVLNIVIDKKVFPYLIAFSSYTRIQLSLVLKFKNNYSFDTYIMLKMLLNRYHKSGQIQLSLVEYKQRLGIGNAYEKNYAMFKKTIIDKVQYDINNSNDLEVNILPIKTGRKVTSLIFKYNSLHIHENHLNINNNIKVDDAFDAYGANERLDFNLKPEGDDQNVVLNNNTIISQLRVYGIKKEKALDLLSSHALEDISRSIDILMQEVKSGKEIPKPAGYLIRVIENSQNTPTSSDLSIMEEEKQKRKNEESELAEKHWLEIESNCIAMQAGIETLFNILKAGKKIFDQQDIESLKGIRTLIEMNQNLISSPRPIMGVYVNNGNSAVNFGLLKQLVNNLIIADPVERLPYLKSVLDNKKAKIIDSTSKTEKESLQIEIKELSELLYSLI
jgi:plasmid replication initiation protein